MTLQPMTQTIDVPTIDADLLDTDAAFTNRGAKAAVFRPRFGQAHQQYFTPQWICQAGADIAERLFDVPVINEQRGGYPLRVIDPTCGSGRLLAPFAQRGHQVLGLELDDRLVPVARRAVGKANVRKGDICAYAASIPEGKWDVAVINPPYGLWWPLDGKLSEYELASRDSIESQHMVLELVTKLLHQSYNRGGLLMALVSGRFWDVNPRAAQYVKRKYQIIANLTLPKPFEDEYGIGVDASLLVAYRVNAHKTKVPAPLTGAFEGSDPRELTKLIVNAYETTEGVGLSRRWNRDVYYLPKRNYQRRLPEVPELSMAVEVKTDDVPLRLTAKGALPEGDWAGVWSRFYQSTPLEAYNQAEGTNTDPMQAFSALPNVLMAGSEDTKRALASLGFDIAMTDKDAEQIGLAAERYQRERLPVRELAPMEYLAWYKDGPITAEASVTIPGASKDGTDVRVLEGETYDLQVRWERQAKQVGQAEQMGKGSRSYVLRKYIDRGYMVFHFTCQDGAHFKVREVDPAQIEAMTQAFGLPEVETVADIDPAELKSWRVQLDHLIDKMAKRNGGLRPYPVQREDILRMATKRQVALLYEMGGGKTMVSAFWAALRGYERVLIVTRASVVPGIVEDLDKWGFKVHHEALDHAEVSAIKKAKRQGEHPDETTFWVASYESMGLGDGNYDEWEHEVYDEHGNLVDVHSGNHRATCSARDCSVSTGSVVKACPHCGARGEDFRSHRGSSRGGPRFCRKCGYRGWSEGLLVPPTEDTEGVDGNHHTPICPDELCAPVVGLRCTP